MGWFGDLLEDTGLSDLLSTGEWRTLRNGKRIKIDSEGRIVSGLPSRYHGVNVRDLSKLSHQERQLEGIDCDDVGHCHACKKTFRTKDEAYVALMRANPQLLELQQSEHGRYDIEFVKWQRGGAPRPEAANAPHRRTARRHQRALRLARRRARPLRLPKPSIRRSRARDAGTTCRRACRRSRRRPG